MGRVGVGMMLALALPWVALGGCNDGPPLPSVSSCGASWRPITGRATTLSQPAALAFADGTLYYPSNPNITPIIQAMSVDDLAVQTLPVTWPGDPLLADDLWVENDHLLVTGFEQFFSIPLAGGAAQLIYDGRPAGNALPDSQFQTYTETDFFWTDSDLTTPTFATTVYRASRSGGDPINLGAVPTLPQGMALGQNAVVLGGIGNAWAVPLDGSPTQQLTGGGEFFAGVDGLGAYYTQIGADPNNPQLLLSPIGGGPVQVFWPSMPAGAGPSNVWSDGQGGWVVAGGQKLDDGFFHLAVWLIDAGGNGRLAACDPSADDSAGAFFPTIAPAIAPDAVYLVSGYLRDDAYWELDKILR